ISSGLQKFACVQLAIRMVLDPIDRGFAQFPICCNRSRKFSDPIEPLACKALRHPPRLQMQRPHPRVTALLAKERRTPRGMERRTRAKRRAALRAPVESRQPSAKPHGPEREVA